jgi:hypothetical protein
MSAVALGVGLGGCQSLQGYPAPIETPKQALDLVRADTQPAAVTTYSAITDPALRRAKRDQIVRARLYAIDINYDDFVRSISAQQKSFAIGSDLVSAGLTGAATLAKSAATKTRLTTYASAALGVRSTVDKELFYSKTLPAVVSQMDASRKTVLAKITEGLAAPDADYPLVAALADLQDYYVAGTLNGALNQIAKDAGVKTQEAEERIAKVTTIAAAYDDPSRKLSAYWRKADGTYDSGHEAKMLACLGPGATTLQLANIIHGAGATQRNALIACLTAAGETL